MNKINIFKHEYINLFIPNDGIEFLHDIITNLGYSLEDLNNPKAKKDTLFVLEKFFKLDLVYVFHWGENNKIMKDQKYSIKETLNYIDSIWFKGAKYPDFYGMIIFGHKKWYTEKLEELGMTNTTNWKWFVENKIGNLEKWIEKNRPKQHKP